MLIAQIIVEYHLKMTKSVVRFSFEYDINDDKKHFSFFCVGNTVVIWFSTRWQFQ